MDNFIELLAVASKEDSSSSWTIAYANHVAMHILRAVVHAVEGLVVAAVAIGLVSHGVLVEA